MSNPNAGPNFPQGPGPNPGAQNPGYGQSPGYGQNPGYGQPFAGAPPTAASNRAVPLLWVIVGTAVVVIVAAILPWVNVGEETKMGTAGDGVFTLILGLIAGGIAVAAIVVKRQQQKLPFIAAVVTIVVGVLVTLIGIVDILDVQSRNNDRGALAEALGVELGVGVGLWLTLVGGLVLLVLGVLAVVASRKPTS